MAQRLEPWRSVGKTKAKERIRVVLVIGLQSTLSGNSFQGFCFSHSFLIQRDQCKQHREIEDGSKEQLPCADNRGLKGEACAVVEKDHSKNERPSRVGDY